MNTLKSPLKRFSVACMALCITLFSYAQIDAFNAVKEAKAISSNPEVIYTMYTGMSKHDLEQNFSNVTGWKISNYYNFFSISREYSSWDTIKAGANVTQLVGVTLDKTDHIIYMTNNFNIDSLRYANEVYDSMYQTLKDNYGEPKISGNYERNTRQAEWVNGDHTYQLTIFPFNSNSYTVKLFVGADRFIKRAL